MRADEVPAHFQHHHRNGEHEPDPEAARHVGEFGIRAAVGGGDLRLQGHAADRAGAGADLADLWMHRAGVDGAFGDGFGGFFFFRQVFLRVGGELVFAAGSTKIIRVTSIVGVVLGGVRVDRHTADRVDGTGRSRFGRALGQIFFRIGEELGAAAVAAEMIGLALVIGVRLAGIGVDRHAADRIDDAASGRCVVMMMWCSAVVFMVDNSRFGTWFRLPAVVSGGSCL